MSVPTRQKRPEEHPPVRSEHLDPMSGARGRWIAVSRPRSISDRLRGAGLDTKGDKSIINGVAKVRELGPDDWRLWRCLRQSALADAPEAFGSALADWTGTGDIEQRWRARLEAVPVNLVITLDDAAVGMVSVAAPDADGMVELISMWVAPGARGRGVGDEAVRQAVACAAQRFPGCRIRLSVKTGNHHAVALYRRHGFVDVGPSPEDGSERRMCR